VKATPATSPERRAGTGYRPDWAVCGPVLVALLYFLPRLISAQFGLLDDAVTLSVCRTVLAHPAVGLHIFEAQGRFLPGYWVYLALLYASGGESPLWFYLGNAALLALTVAALGVLLRKFGAGAFETWTAGLFFVFSAAAAECYFTLSKGEPVLFLELLASLLVACRAVRSRWPLAHWSLAALLMLLAITTREPAAAWIGVVAVWLLLSFRRGFDKALLPRKTLAAYFLALLAGAAPAVIGRLILRHAFPPGSYSSGYQLTWQNVSQSLLNWSYSLIRDFPALCLLLVCAGILAWRRRLERPQPLAMLLAWMAGFVAVLLPWRDFHPYYQLAFSGGSSLFCGLAAGEFLTYARKGQRWAWVVLSAAGVLLGITAIDSANAARYQIQVDEANTALLENLQKLPPDSIVAVNLPFDHEYVYELKLYLSEHLGRPDLRFVPLDYTSPDPRDAGHPRFVVSENLAHQPWPLVRGPLAEPAVESWDKVWEQASGARPAVQAARTWQMADIGLEVFGCTALDWLKLHPAAACGPLRPPVDLRQTTYGWSVYAEPAWKDPVQVASFSADGVWAIAQASGQPVRLALGAHGDEPIAADWDGDGLLEPGVYRPSTNTWLVDVNLEGKPGLVFRLPGMRPGDLPVAGRWDGSRAEPGFYRPSDGTWHLFRSSESPAEDLPVVHFGSAGAIPLTGDWTRYGRSTPGLYQPETGAVTLLDSFRDDALRIGYALPPGMPVVVNWTGAGVDTVNTVSHGNWTRRLANCACDPSNPLPAFSAPLTEGRLFAGRWKTPRTVFQVKRP
jgi:hypothetical protein